MTTTNKESDEVEIFAEQLAKIFILQIEKEKPQVGINRRKKRFIALKKELKINNKK